MKNLLRFVGLIIAATFGAYLATNMTAVNADTTEPITTVEVTEVLTTVPEELPDLLGDNLLDTVAPKAQLVFQIGQAIITAIGLVVIFKQRIEVAVAKRKEAEANGELTVERSERQMVLKVLNTLGYTMNIIVQNSKLPTEDRIAISKLISDDQVAMAQLSDTIAQISGLSKTDVSGILDSLKDVMNVGVGAVTAVKTGNIDALTDVLGDVEKG